MLVYLASRYSRRVELCGYRDELAEHGIGVTSRWLLGKHQIDNVGQPIGDAGEKLVEAGGPEADRLREFFVREDVADVIAADTLVAFTESPRDGGGRSRGGRHVELGIAIGTGKRLFIVGPRENLFCWLPQIVQFDTWEECREALRRWNLLDAGVEDEGGVVFDPDQIALFDRDLSVNPEALS